MLIVLLVIHVMLALAIIGIVLVQRSEGGGLGIGGGGGMSGFMTGRSQANLLTRSTSILVAGFMLTSILLAVLNAHAHGVQPSLLDRIPDQTQPSPTTSGNSPPEVPGPRSVAPADTPPPGPAAESPNTAPSSAPAAPVKPAAPGVPLAR